ncbi:MAG TPA: hypothetical protein ENO16_03170, partial [Chromatiales bacterium]|nr:hypothetical protein [Chromatiales bacterium]
MPNARSSWPPPRWISACWARPTTMLEPIFTPNVQQAVFRDLLKAQSFPGLPVALTPTLHGVCAHRAVLAALLDGEVSLADPFNLLSADGDWPFLEARRAAPEQADF